MKKDILTVLGCSSSIALTLLVTHPAQANGIERELVFNAPIPLIAEGEFDCSCSADMANEWNDELGDKAIATLGCDCSGCRRIALMMAEEEPSMN